eukprot:gene28427-39_t
MRWGGHDCLLYVYGGGLRGGRGAAAAAPVLPVGVPEAAGRWGDAGLAADDP